MRHCICASAEKIVLVVGIQGIKLVLGADTAIQRFAILPELHVAQASADAAVAIGVEGIEVGRRALLSAFNTFI